MIELDFFRSLVGVEALNGVDQHDGADQRDLEFNRGGLVCFEFGS